MALTTPTLPIRLLIAAIAGASTTFAFAPFGFWPVAIIAPGVLYWLLGQQSPSRVFLITWSFATALFLAGASWIYVSIHNFGNAPAPLAAVMTVLFCFFMGLFVSGPLWLYARLLTHGPIQFAAAFTLAEAFRSWFLTGFPWLYLGNSQIDAPLAPWAPVIGVLGISFILALTGIGIAALIERHKVPLIASLLLWIAAWPLSHVTWTQQSGEPVNVAMVQANIPQAIKWELSNYQPTLDLYQELSKPLWSNNDIVIWPEAAIPNVLDRAGHFLEPMSAIAASSNTALITGILTRQERGYHNTMVALGTANGQYHKRHLVPFGEYVPLESILRGLIDFFDMQTSHISPGPNKQPLLEAAGLKLAAMTCYEIVYPQLVATDAKRADIILTASNDGWFGDSIGPHQHMEMARMRALENGRWVIRSTGSGISALVNPKGKITNTIPQFSKGVLQGQVWAQVGVTPFALFGGWPLLVFCTAVLLLMRKT